VVPVVGIPQFVEKSLALGQDRENSVIGVDWAWLKDEVAMLIDLVLALLVIPARLLQGEMVLGDALPNPGEVAAGFLGVYDGNWLTMLIVEESGGKRDEAMILCSSSSITGLARLSQCFTSSDRGRRIFGCPS
jgi:hypothetical protein